MSFVAFASVMAEAKTEWPVPESGTVGETSGSGTGPDQGLRGETVMRGFLGGVSIGALVAVAGGAMWSLSVPLPGSIEVGGAVPARAPQVEETALTPEVTAERRDPDLVEALPTTPDGQSDTAGGDDLSALVGADTTSGARPVIGTAQEVVAGNTSVVAPVDPIATETAQSPAAEQPADAPVLPQVESRVEVSTEPASPTVQEPAVSETGNELAQGEEREVATGADDNNLGNESAAETSGDPVLAEISVPEIGRAPEVTALPQFNTPGQAPIVSSATPGTTVEEEDSPLLPQAGTVETETSQDEAQADEVIAGLPVSGGQDEQEITPQIGTRIVPLTDRDRETETSQEGAEELPPFEANSSTFQPSADMPVMSIVLIDDEKSLGGEALAEFPYPITFAIDPADPRAQQKMAHWRKAGFEVLILADLPQDAAPQDAETAFAVWKELVPEAVGVLEGVKTGFHGNRALADQVSALLQDTGYGMVTQNNGLNTVQKLALRDGMPAGVVFRDFDGAGQNPRAIRRFLDQAAFRARQEGAVIMLGRLQPDTISALLLWGLQDRASQVNLAPVSSSLKAKMNSDS